MVKPEMALTQRGLSPSPAPLVITSWPLMTASVPSTLSPPRDQSLRSVDVKLPFVNRGPGGSTVSVTFKLNVSDALNPPGSVAVTLNECVPAGGGGGDDHV